MSVRRPLGSPVTVVTVCGPPRSGTTMMANLLSGYPAHPLLPECQVVTDLIRERLRSERELGEAKFGIFLHDRDFADSVYRTAIQSILEEVLKRSDSYVDYLVLKDPSLLFYLDVLERFFSWPLRKVCIVRDPRDSIASYMSVRLREGQRPPIEEAIDFISPYLDPIMRLHADPGTTMVVRYEDIVRRIAEVEQRISAFVGYDVDFDGYPGLASEELDLSDPWSTPLYGSPLTDTQIRGYERVLSPEEFYYLNDVFSGVLDAYYAAPDEVALSGSGEPLSA